MKIILASQSPFRRHALDVLGVSYETIPSNFDESSVRDKDPKELARKLSESKALTIGEAHIDDVVIASDLLVVSNGIILEKPKDEQDAFEMLSRLSGSCFEIITGLAVYNAKNKKMLSAVETCSVTFRRLEDHEIRDYIARYPAVKCAGAFEDNGLLRFAESISGSYNFRAAMPVNKLVYFLREQGIKV